MDVQPYGQHALLLPCADGNQVQALLAQLRTTELSGVRDVVAGARSVVVVAEPTHADMAALRDTLAAIQPTVTAHHAGATLTLPVAYDGADLDEVAQRCGLSVATLIELHVGAIYQVAFCGFAPGFAYLSGLPEALRLPRRSSPRAQVPAGAVAIADEYSAVYPTSSPGGWWLLGTTGETMWDIQRDPPALLQPGDTVRFVRA